MLTTTIPKTRREFERYLYDLGYSRKQSRRFAAAFPAYPDPDDDPDRIFREALDAVREVAAETLV